MSGSLSISQGISRSPELIEGRPDFFSGLLEGGAEFLTARLPSVMGKELPNGDDGGGGRAEELMTPAATRAPPGQ